MRGDDRVRPLLLLCLALPALAAPRFADAVKKFPLVAPPLSVTVPGPLKTKLTNADLKALGLDGDELLADFQRKPQKGEQRTLWAHARVQRSGHQVLFLRLDVELAKHVRQQTLLYAFDERGTFLGRWLFHEQSTLDGVVTTNASTLTPAGALGRVSKVVRPQAEPGLTEDCVVTSEQRGKLTAAGGLELLPTFWTARSGAYVDPKTGEELRVLVKRVFFRAKGDAPFVELIGDGNSMRLPDQLEPWRFTWNDRRSEVSAQNPAGALQLFVRVW